MNTGNIYLHKILGITLRWGLWEDFFTHNTEEYCMLSTVGRFIYTQYWGILYGEHWEDLFTQNTGDYFLLNTGKIYLNKILGITLCWALWEDLFTQNTEEYCMLSTVGRFIYTQYWGILYVEHCGKIYLHKILRNTLCCTLWEDLFTQTTGKYFMLSTVGIFIYIQYWGLLYVEHCGKHYLQKILVITLCWTLKRFIYTKY
jgi:hypothetical protein